MSLRNFSYNSVFMTTTSQSSSLRSKSIIVTHGISMSSRWMISVEEKVKTLLSCCCHFYCCCHVVAAVFHIVVAVVLLLSSSCYYYCCNVVVFIVVVMLLLLLPCHYCCCCCYYFTFIVILLLFSLSKRRTTKKPLALVTFSFPYHQSHQSQSYHHKYIGQLSSPSCGYFVELRFVTWHIS
jgi:hypothetical protein